MKGHIVKNQKSQSGSAHLIVLIILVVLLIGSLGFIFWQNFLNKPKGNTNQTTTSAEETKSYSNDYYSFNYPSTGWAITAGKINEGDPDVGDQYVSIKTNPYTDGEGMSGDLGPKVGAKIDIESFSRYDNNGPSTWQENLQSQADEGIIHDLTKITVDGQEAYKYKFDYEWMPFIATEFHKNNVQYTVKMYAQDGDFEPYNSVYDIVINSLSVK